MPDLRDTFAAAAPALDLLFTERGTLSRRGEVTDEWGETTTQSTIVAEDVPYFVGTPRGSTFGLAYTTAKVQSEAQYEIVFPLGTDVLPGDTLEGGGRKFTITDAPQVTYGLNRPTLAEEDS